MGRERFQGVEVRRSTGWRVAEEPILHEASIGVERPQQEQTEKRIT